MAKGSKGKRTADGISVGQPDTTARENAAVENDNITEDAIADATAVAENVNAQEENAESETASEAVAAGATCEAAESAENCAEEVAENVAEEEEQTQTAGSDAENDTMKPELSWKYVFIFSKKASKDILSTRSREWRRVCSARLLRVPFSDKSERGYKAREQMRALR